MRREARFILGESGGRRVLICSHSISCSPRDRRKGEAPPERRENPWVRWLIEAFHTRSARAFITPTPRRGASSSFPLPLPTSPHFFVLFSFLPPFFYFSSFSAGFWSRASLDQSYFRYFGYVVFSIKQRESIHSPLLVLNRSLVL